MVREFLAQRLDPRDRLAKVVPDRLHRLVFVARRNSFDNRTMTGQDVQHLALLGQVWVPNPFQMTRAFPHNLVQPPRFSSTNGV